MRIVVGGPRLRRAEPIEAQIARTVAPLRRHSEHAAGLGLELAVENHGDLTIAELTLLLERVGEPNLGICLDTANVVRLGEQLPEACAMAAPRVKMVHLKDTAAGTFDPIAGPPSAPYGSGTLPLEQALQALASPLAAGAPVCLEVGQVAQGDDELALLASGIVWLSELRR